METTIGQLNAMLCSQTLIGGVALHAPYPNFVRVCLNKVDFNDDEEFFIVAVTDLETRLSTHYREIGIEGAVRLWQEVFFPDPMSDDMVTKSVQNFQIKGIDFDCINVRDQCD